MIGHRRDVLADIPLRRRLDREREDAQYLISRPDIIKSASKESLKRDNNTWAGIDTFAASHLKAHEPGDPTDGIVCARIDLDHPLYFADNLFTTCDDCGCDLQFRPDVPARPGQGVVFLCICCMARRLREKA